MIKILMIKDMMSINVNEVTKDKIEQNEVIKVKSILMMKYIKTGITSIRIKCKKGIPVKYVVLNLHASPMNIRFNEKNKKMRLILSTIADFMKLLLKPIENLFEDSELISLFNWNNRYKEKFKVF